MTDERPHSLRRHLATWATVAVVGWVAHFAGWRHLGFLTDDQTFAAVGVNMSPADAAGYVRWCAANFPEPQGRPLGFLLGVEIPFAAFHLGGLAGLWVSAWLILTVNAGLLYHLLARRAAGPLPAVAAVAFVLYPADTTRPFLCHADVLQPSLTLTLLAAHLLLSRRRWVRWLAYPVAGLTLVTYETAVLPFLAVPLLDDDHDRGGRGTRGVRRVARHLVAVAVMVAAFGLVRHAAGDYRVADVAGNKAVVLAEAAAGFALGPAAAAASCGYRAWVGAAYLVGHPAWAGAAAAVVALVALRRSRAVSARTDDGTPSSVSPVRAARVTDDGVPSSVRADTARLCYGPNRDVVPFATVAFLAAYAFSFFHFPPVALWGQVTSVHTAAALGGATLMAAAVVALFRRARRSVATAIIAAYGILLLAAAVGDRQAYAELWAQRQRFWPQVFALCPDATDGTLIVVDGPLPGVPRQLPASTWADTEVPGECYVYPLPTAAPIVCCYPKEHRSVRWPAAVTRDFDGRLVWADDQEPYLHRPGERLPEGNTILLHRDAAGRLTRESGTITVAGGSFDLRPAPPPGMPTPFPPRPFRDVLCGPEQP